VKSGWSLKLHPFYFVILETMERYGVPTIFAIFGVTGDLAQKKIFPALMDLYIKDLLPKKFAIIGVARRGLSKTDFQNFVKEAVLQKKKYRANAIDGFLEHFQYSQGQFDDVSTYEKTRELLDSIDQSWGQCSNKLLYLSVPPSLYELILNNLADSGLSVPCDDESGWTRILIEKPFGKDAETAQKLDALLGKLFQEKQVYRIDHYLKKQTLQNIMAFRFSNTIFEPLWNRKYIRAIEINLLEADTIQSRGSFYDSNGALRDVGQNHLLQMLALVAMEQPQSMDCAEVRKAREGVFRRLKKYSKKDVDRYLLRAQYNGYLKAEGVKKDSQTETFFSVVSHIKNKRWRGVPFYLTSGKALNESRVEIVVHFKDNTPGSFMPEQYQGQEANKLTFVIQPDEKISILFWIKKPSFEDKIEPRELSFSFHEANTEHIDAYQKVLFDCISGDQTSFISTPEILYTWEYVMSIKNIISALPLYKYEVGSEPKDIKKLQANLKTI